MPVYKDVNGTYYVSYRVKDKFTGKLMQKKKRGFQTKKEATHFLASIIEEDGTSTKGTLAELVEKYIESREAYANGDTQARFYRTLELYADELLDLPIKKLTKEVMNDWHTKIAKSDISYRTKNKVITYMKSVSAFGYKIYDLYDFGKGLEKFKPKSTDVEPMKVWTYAQFDLFLEQEEDYTFKAFFYFLYNTGLRRGEAIALQKTDVVNGKVNVTKAMRHYKQGFTPLKNASSKRTVLLNQKTIDFIQPLYDTKGAFLFGGEKPLSITSIQRHFDAATKKAQSIDPSLESITLHDLRHSHATNLINNGANIVAVSKRLGHSSTEMTLSVYTHLLDKSAEELVGILDDISS